MTTENKIKYFESREDWRKWLNKSSGKKSILHNDAVEEALCFDWIDSTIKSFDNEHKIQRFTSKTKTGE